MVNYDRDDPLLMICAHVTALQRASKNRLVELFCALREANGWVVEWVLKKAPIGPHDLAREMLEAERRDMLLNAERVADADYIELDMKVTKGAALSKEERITHERNHFERAVGVPLDEELVEMNIDGGLLDKIATLAAIVSIWSRDCPDGLVDALLAPTATLNGRLQGTKPELLIAVLIRGAGLSKVDGFKTGELLCGDSLTRFVSLCRKNRTVIEEILGEPLRNDFPAKPVRQLNRFLRRIGLELVLADTKKVAGRKIRYYTIPAGVLETMMNLSRSYLKVKARQEATKEKALLEDRRRRGTALKMVVEESDSSGEMGLLSSRVLRNA